ncbi:MAG: DUF4124 domain-containing protein [Gammaproteobacteria bacterium]
MQVLHALLTHSRALTLATLAVLVTGTASAQWQWIGADGRKVFSDTAPPSSIPEKSILKRPGSVPMPSPADDNEEPGKAAPPAALPKVPATDPQLEAKKKQAEEAEAAKRKAELERVAKARAENCERAQRAKATLDSGVRIATTNAKGEREILDDKGRAAETQRLERIIASDCGPMPAQQ